MVVRRPAWALSLALLLSLVALPSSAQDTGFLLLGTDATGDPALNGVPVIDTWVDINSLSVATIGEDLVFHMGLQGTTTEIGSYCWMAAFEFAGTEYVGLDCYEGVAYENDNSLSGARRPDTSRGTNVASDVSFVDDGVLITIPLAAIGAKRGDVIDDIYGLTYATRALTVVDTIPDAKRTAAADESLGSYRIGGPVEDAVPAPVGQLINETLNTTGFVHDFANATSDDYQLNFTVPWDNATLSYVANISAGTANVTVLRNGTDVFSILLVPPGNATGNATGNMTGNATGNSTGNATGNAAGNSTLGAAPFVVRQATGNWTVRIDYDSFVGQLRLNVTEHVPLEAPAANTTVETTSDEAPAEEEAPGLGVSLLAGVLAVAAALRRRR